MVSSVPPITPVGALARVHHDEQVGAVVDRDLRPALQPARRRAARRCRASSPRDGVHLASPRPAPPPRRPASTAGWPRRAPPRAPPARSARMRLAVSAVTCRQAATRTPSSGRSAPNRSRDLSEHGHLPVGPGDPGLARRGEIRIGDVDISARTVPCAGSPIVPPAPIHLVAVVVRLVGALDRHADVGRLLRAAAR